MKLHLSRNQVYLNKPLRLILDSWMASVGFTFGYGARKLYSRGKDAVLVLALRGESIEAIGAYLPNVPNSPVVIVRSNKRQIPPQYKQLP